jgi:hypothetical protein
MQSFTNFLNESDKFVCRCLREHLTESVYNEQRKKYPNMDKQGFFRKLKDYLKEKANIQTCNNQCEQRKNKNYYEIFYEDLD